MSFLAFARAHGLVIDDLHPSERIRRCPTDTHPRSTNGAYFYDGSRGWVFCWDGEAKTHWYDDPNAKPWSEEEKKAWARRRQQADAQQERRRQQAARDAAEMIRQAVPGPHDYLARKHLSNVQGLVMPDGALLVPMRNWRDNNIQGAQVIRWLPDERVFDKKMLPGMRAKGAVLRLGQGRETILCEGYATGLSIELAVRSVGLPASVLVTFSATNLVHVAQFLKGRVFVFADNDKSEAGERAAQDTGHPYCMSDVVGEDANDVHARAGLMAVAQMLMRVRRSEAVASG